MGVTLPAKLHMLAPLTLGRK